MLGLESQRRLKNFLIAVCQGEKEIEVARKYLANLPDFVPKTAFERIDRDNYGDITELEIMDFLHDNGIWDITENEVFHLVSYFDFNGNMTLSQEELIQMFLPCNDNNLREKTRVKYGVKPLRYESLSAKVEKAMADVMVKEVNFQRILEDLKRDLAACPDYTWSAAYNTIERIDLAGLLDSDNIGEFLASHGEYITEAELTAIVRRMDSNGDCTITQAEFCEFLKPLPGVVKTTIARHSLVPARTLAKKSGSPVRVKTGAASLVDDSPAARARLIRATSAGRLSYPFTSSRYSYNRPYFNDYVGSNVYKNSILKKRSSLAKL
jgi:Ca2+-binding EF-hand superfamily protein